MLPPTQWPQKGIAIAGDFSGIQGFVFRPVPGAGGAAARLRARSFRVLASTRLAAQAVMDCLPDANPRLCYSAGGRFLVVAEPTNAWADRLAQLRRRLDQTLLTDHRGELTFHLAAVEYTGNKIPIQQLATEMDLRKAEPLAGALRGAAGWATERFTFAGANEGKCSGCAATRPIASADEPSCQTCLDDRELGAALLNAQAAGLRATSNGPISFLGRHWSITQGGPFAIPFIAHTPTADGRLATFEQLAGRSHGCRYLAYLRIDADRVGHAFRELSGDPGPTQQLSKRLNDFFSRSVTDALRGSFPNLYPVYGGGDDLFVVGPWNEALDFAANLRSEFREELNHQLTFSAGLALAKPRQHILAKAADSELALNEHAKTPRDSIHALGATIPWSEFDGVQHCARRLADLRAQRRIPGTFLQDLVQLHGRWKGGDARWHSLLSYQVNRNLSGEARELAQRAFLSPGQLWQHAGYAATYAFLYSRDEQTE